MHRCNQYPGGTRRRGVFIVLAQDSVAIEPAEGSLNLPSLQDGRKAWPVINPAPDFEIPRAMLVHPGDQGSTIGLVGPDFAQGWNLAQGLGEHLTSCSTIRTRGAVHQEHQNQAEGIDQQVALASGHLFPTVIPSYPRCGPPASVVLTLWVSMQPAVGCGAFPVAYRTCARKAACAARSRPSMRQVRKQVATVCQFGYSCGKYRHGQPVRARYKRAFMMSRRSTVGRLPRRCEPWASRGSTSAHSASVKSEG